MTITVELPFEIEAQLRENVARRDMDTVRHLLVEALTPTVEALMQGTLTELIDTEFEAIADQLADGLIACTGPNPPSLSDDAVSREGIYEVHP